MQHKFAKDRLDFQQQQESNEAKLRARVQALEQELAVLKRQLKTKTTEGEDLNAEVVSELQSLEAKYRQSDDDLRQENNSLRKQTAALNKQLRECQVVITNQRQSLDVKTFEQFSQLKRLDENLKQIRVEVKSAFKLMDSYRQQQEQLPMVEQTVFEMSSVDDTQQCELLKEL